MTYFDHWLKEEVKIKYYYRYADDIVILHNNKDVLKKYLILIKLYLKHELKLNIKNNYQIFPIDNRGISFVGYVFYHHKIKIRKNIKTNINKKINKYKNNKITKEKFKRIMCSYFGWLKYCNSKHYLKTLEIKTNIHYSNWNGIESNISKFYNKTIKIIDICDYFKYYKINFIYNNKPYSVKSTSVYLYLFLKQKCKLPCILKIKHYDKRIKKN